MTVRTVCHVTKLPQQCAPTNVWVAQRLVAQPEAYKQLSHLRTTSQVTYLWLVTHHKFVSAVHDLGCCQSSTWHTSLLTVLHGCQLTHLRVVHTWDFPAIHTARVAVVASTVGGGARQRALSGDTPTHSPVHQGAAVVKQVLGLLVLWPPSFRVLDCLHPARSMCEQTAP